MKVLVGRLRSLFKELGVVVGKEIRSAGHPRAKVLAGSWKKKLVLPGPLQAVDP